MKKQSLDKIYQWSCRLSTEQGEEEYFWTEETLALLNRLKTSKGNMIAVIGLQGVGKTALRQALFRKLSEENFKVYSLKWVGSPEETLIKSISYVEGKFLDNSDLNYFKELFYELFRRHWIKGEDSWSTAEKISKALGLKSSDEEIKYGIEEFIRAAYGRGENIHEADKLAKHLSQILTPLLEKALGSKKVMEVRKFLFQDRLQSANVILIDLPDYERGNIKQMNRDLTAIQEWWEGIFTSQFEGYTQDVSLVIFFQKELFQGHFFMGKLDVYELHPLTPKDMLSCYEQNFKSHEPFTREALIELAFLSRGIFRRFKKYVRICLDHVMQKDIETVTPEHVKQWIGLDQLVKDMELELMTIFPKERENRILSVKLLKRLMESGPLTQSEVAEEVFDGAEMKASRVLGRLESWNYIKRERRGKDKIVSLL